MKLTLCIMQQCNLRCSYCYIGKKPAVMTPDTAARGVDLFFRLAPPGEELNIGFFGGEPLLQLKLIKDIVGLVEAHASYSAERVTFSLVTNGTIWSDAVADFIRDHDVNLCISSDGAPPVQNAARRYASDGGGTSAAVARTIGAALEAVPSLLVNSVYGPATLSYLPDSVAYHCALGVRRIFLSPDYSAKWLLSVEGALQPPPPGGGGVAPMSTAMPGYVCVVCSDHGCRLSACGHLGVDLPPVALIFLSLPVVPTMMQAPSGKDDRPSAHGNYLQRRSAW